MTHAAHGYVRRSIVYWPVICSIVIAVSCFSSHAAAQSIDCDAQLLADELVSGPGVLLEGRILIDGDMLVAEELLTSRGTFTTSLWPNGTVPYEFNGLTDERRAKVIAAMQVWQALGHIQFRCRTDEDGSWVRIQHWNVDDVSHSDVGWGIGQRLIEVGAGGGDTPKVLMHELGHLLGLWHEQSRTDRDQYVRIIDENVCSDCCGFPYCGYAFWVEGSSKKYGPYDFNSIMHYKQCQFSRCGAECDDDPESCRTIEVLGDAAAEWQDHLGSPEPSPIDAVTISLLYPHPNTVFVDTTGDNAFEEGTFFEPIKDLGDGYNATPEGGHLIILQPTSYDGRQVYDKGMTIEIPFGSVVLR